MTDPMELVGRAEHFDGAHKRGCEGRSWTCTCGDDETAMNLIAQMATCIREMVEETVERFANEMGDVIGNPSGYADAILAALASSGDHAELARAIDRLLPITIQNTPDYAEVSFGECQAQAMTLEPETWLALNQLPSLIAEVAALRGANDRLKLAICGGEDVPGAIAAVTVEDCERLCRENHAARGDFIDRATEAERKLAEAVGLLQGVDGGAATQDWWRVNVRTFLSKEAERG